MRGAADRGRGVAGSNRREAVRRSMMDLSEKPVPVAERSDTFEQHHHHESVRHSLVPDRWLFDRLLRLLFE